MSVMREQFANLLEYIGIRSKNYSHTGRELRYNQDNALYYYLDQTLRANYSGPYNSNGLPLLVKKDKTDYHHISICFYALGHLQIYLDTDNTGSLDTFIKISEWFVDQQLTDGSWLSPFPMPKFNLHGPHPSAMIQGLAISCLIRAYKITNDDKFLKSSINGLDIFDRDIKDGGVTSNEDDIIFYEEYPSYPIKRVLNGFIYTLWGLYDMVRIDNNAKADKLYQTGLKSLEILLPKFDMGYWSLYHISNEGPVNPTAVHYHRLHIAQLEVMYQITGNELFKEYSSKWEKYLNGRFNALRTLPAKLKWRMES